MVIFSLLPVGLMQTWASVKYGYWYARSAEFLQTSLMQTLRWIRALVIQSLRLEQLILSLLCISVINKIQERKIK